MSSGRFPRSIRASDFAIATNGFADGPSQALRDHLVRRGARRVVTIAHPLLREGDTRHEVRIDESGGRQQIRRVALPCRPPYTYPLDLLVPAWPPAVDAWFGFNGLAAARGIAASSRLGARASGLLVRGLRPGAVRQGPGHGRLRSGQPPLLPPSRPARRALPGGPGRSRSAPPPGSGEPRPGRGRPDGRVARPGAGDRSGDAVAARRVVYMGHLVERQGVGTLIDALAALARRGAGVQADIVGRGDWSQPFGAGRPTRAWPTRSASTGSCRITATWSGSSPRARWRSRPTPPAATRSRGSPTPAS